MASIELRGLSKSFGRTEVIRGVDLKIEDGEFVVLVGPSGCGKSTLLRLIAGLEDISRGELLIDGERVNAWPPKQRGVAMVFQSYALYPHMTAYENMAFGLQLAKADRRTVDEAVREAAQMLELTPLLDRLPRELSGGQRQRVAIGRAIVRKPRVFLFDEPLSNLDAALRVQMRLELAGLHRATAATMVYVTHDQVEAMTLADKVVVLSQGRVEQVGAPLALYHHPANRFVAGFIGSPQMNFVDAVVCELGAGEVEVEIAPSLRLCLAVEGAGLQAGDRVTVGVRPEHLAVVPDGLPEASAGPVSTARVQAVEQLGDAHLLHLKGESGTPLTVRANGDAAVRRNEAVTLSWPTEHLHLFRGDGRACPRRTAG